jgi:hypothetical protein
MFALVAFAQANALEALVAPSPHRSKRPGRSQRKAGGLFAAIASPFKRAIAWVDSEPTLPFIPYRATFQH